MENGHEDSFSSHIAICVMNAFLSYTAIMLNSVTIHAIRKTSSLPRPLKALITSLAVSDLGVGLIAIPLCITLRIMEIQQNDKNNSTYSTTYIAYLILGSLLAFASFFGVMALTVDRFLAIHLHLRYQELVTHKRVVAVVISSWVICTISYRLWIPKNIIFTIFAAIMVACIITATYFSVKIFLTARRHTNQIQLLQQQIVQNDDIVNFSRVRKSAITAIYIYLVFLVCYLPSIFIFCLGTTTTSTTSRSLSTAVKVLPFYTLTLVFLNSSLNPLIYCWKVRYIRHAFLAMVRKKLPHH